MKRLLALILAAICALSMAACSSDNSSNDDKDDKKTEEKELSPYDKALNYIENGKYEDAFYILRDLAKGGNKDAEKKIADFHVVCAQRTDIMEDGDIKIAYVYDKYGYETSGKATYNGKTDTVIYTNTYDDNGRLIKLHYKYVEDGFWCTEEYTYNESGKKTKEVRMKIDTGDKQNITEWTYDSKGNLIKENETDFNGYAHTIEYTYDEKGNMTKEVYTYSSGSADTTEYTYDEKGYLIKETGDSYDTTYSYDDNGRLIKETWNSKYSSTSTTDYTYDENGNLIKETEDSGAVTNYSYDEKGNLIKMVSVSQSREYKVEYADVLVFYRPGNADNSIYY